MKPYKQMWASEEFYRLNKSLASKLNKKDYETTFVIANFIREHEDELIFNYKKPKRPRFNMRF